MNEISFRPYRPDDLEPIKKLTIESFGGVTIEENVEISLGILNGHDWRWRKARHIDEDVAANPTGIFVAEQDGRFVGYITTRIDREAGRGRIPNLAVAAEFRGRGLYKATVARRAELARERGYRWLYVDALPTSRPILERLGFVKLTTTRPYVIPRAAD